MGFEHLPLSGSVKETTKRKFPAREGALLPAGLARKAEMASGSVLLMAALDEALPA